jgi:hypothetical protein
MRPKPAPFVPSPVKRSLQFVYFAFGCEQQIIALVAGPEVIYSGWNTFLPLRRQRLLAVDDWGIRWRSRGWRATEHTLSWHEVKGFCEHRHKSGYRSSTAYTYTLFGDTQTFAWILPAGAKSTKRSATELLCRIVVTRTGCALRDITASADILSGWSAPLGLVPKTSPVDHEPRKSLIAALVSIRNRDGWHMPQLAHEDAAISPIRMSKRFYFINAVLLVIVVLVLCGGWLVNHLPSEAYLRALSATAVETALFSDSLMLFE